MDSSVFPVNSKLSLLNYDEEYNLDSSSSNPIVERQSFALIRAIGIILVSNNMYSVWNSYY